MKHVFILILLLFSTQLFGQEKLTSFEQVKTFYPNEEVINNENIQWGFFTVPEDWEDANSKKIKLAIAILKNTSKSKDTNPVVMIDGGPGAGSIEGIWWWLNHPLREKSDIILVDARGTGFSKPRLCPGLGNKLLKILAKNQNASKDKKEKILAAMACKQELISKGIDIESYNSINIVKDLHALKLYLKYQDWNVYGVSYGTYVAQVYANIYPNDIRTLVLDSPISDLSKYYTSNTSNYINSLNKFFKACKNNQACNASYPDLEKIYYQIIEELTKNPITVKVDKSIIEKGTFTYNAEDFKIVTQQALYHKKLIEALPLLIYQFHNRNKSALSKLVTAFSGALGLDYGVYYCVTCNEVIPINPIQAYNNDANKYPELNGGLSFYSSDFSVCDKWNQKINKKNKNYPDHKIDVPTLIFNGEFDPITPSKNGDSLAIQIKNSYLVKANSYGHASSFTRKGFKITNEFINSPNKKILNNDFNSDKLNFVKNIYINGGVSRLGNSLNDFNLLFFSPLAIALLISLISIFAYMGSFIRDKEKNKINKLIKILLIINSLLGILLITGFIVAINNTASENFYILAFGLPQTYSYLFKLLVVFFVSLLVSLIFFFFSLKKIKNRSILFTVLFSNVLIGIYFVYWGIIQIF